MVLSCLDRMEVVNAQGGGGGEQLKHAIAVDIVALGVWPLLSNLEDPELGPRVIAR